MVIIGSARIDENGKLAGGKAGDQTDKEVSTQEFYVHSKGWMVLRPKSKAMADDLASSMYTACKNVHIGYDQNQRLNILKVGVNATTDTECDCGTLIRCCIIAASGKDPGNFTTLNEVSVLKKTGLFEEPFEYKAGTILYAGDVLVTKTKGHTAAVVSSDHKRTAPQQYLKLDPNKSQQAEFLARIVPMAQRQAAEHNYRLFPSVTIAQACLESGWGTAKKMVAANALMGVKVGKSAYKFGKAWHGAAYKTGTTEYYDGKNATKITDYFRQYDKLEDSICDYMDMLLHCERYRRAVDCRSPEESIKGIIEGNYATDPNYLAKVLSIINKYDLKKFDKNGVINNVCPYSIPDVNNRNTLKRGCRGDTVKALQWSLNLLMGKDLMIDGNFGPATEAAVKEFQKKAGIAVDGQAGKNTWEKIRSML